MSTALLDQVLQRPDAYLFMDRLHAALDLEKATRQHFYEIVEENKKMEFINGEIVFHSPVKLWHNDATGNVYEILRTYVRRQNMGRVGVEKLLISLTRNDYEPDVCFWKSEKADLFDDEQMRFPAPDFVAEVLSPSTAKNDRGVKFDDYESHGVQEYWIIDPEKQTLEQHVLENGQYDLRLKASEGTVHCVAIEGLHFPIRAIFDEAENAAVLAWLWQ
jgi:Uma2 family endonuclease